MIELEKTYLVKEIPVDLSKCKFNEMIDIYIPKDSSHPKLRIRKNGDSFSITKKELLDKNDASQQKEHTIILTEEEFNSLKKVEGKKIHKLRYYFDYKNRQCELDIFLDELKGLILADFEFDKVEEKDKFEMPEFCLVDVTQDEDIAGGVLCGKTYDQLKDYLDKYKYKRLLLNN
jgi:CYTH domain-containing protein